MTEKPKTKAPTESTKQMLAEFPPSEAELDLRPLYTPPCFVDCIRLGDLTDVQIWEGASNTVRLKREQRRMRDR